MHICDRSNNGNNGDSIQPLAGSGCSGISHRDDALRSLQRFYKNSSFRNVPFHHAICSACSDSTGGSLAGT